MKNIMETLATSTDKQAMYIYQAFTRKQLANSDLAYEFEEGELKDESAIVAARTILVELTKNETTAAQLQAILAEEKADESFAAMGLILGIGGLIAVLQILDSVSVEYKKDAEGKKTLDISYKSSGRIVDIIKEVTNLVAKLGVKVVLKQE